jgi:hypothetical protein
MTHATPPAPLGNRCPDSGQGPRTTLLAFTDPGATLCSARQDARGPVGGQTIGPAWCESPEIPLTERR